MGRQSERAVPLAGVRVLDVTANMTGPFATMLLAEQGADVVKVEPPGGDVIRRVGPARDGTSAYFASLNRGKRSIVIDLQTSVGVDLVSRLAEWADVFIENFRPGVAERLGLARHALRLVNPQLIYVSINGFGPDGPLASLPAYDHVMQALSGIAARQAGRDGVPTLVRHGIVDKATGYTAAQAVTAALFERERTGVGRHIEVAMIDVALSFLWPDGMMTETCLDPVRDAPSIANTFRTSKTADGYLCLITVTDRQFRGLLRAVGLEHLLEDERLQNLEERVKIGGEAMRRVATVMAGMTTDEVIQRLRAEDVPCAPVVDLADVASSEVVRSRGSVVEMADPVLGRILQPVAGARFDGTANGPFCAPALGQHTDQVLRSISLSDADIDQLRQEGVVA